MSEENKDPLGEYIDSRIEALKPQEVKAKHEELVKYLNEKGFRLSGFYADDEIYLELAEGSHPYMVEYYEGKWQLYP